MRASGLVSKGSTNEGQRVATNCWLGQLGAKCLPSAETSTEQCVLKDTRKDQDARVWANRAIREDLEWARQKITMSDGVLLLKSVSWEIKEATCVMETDACPEGMCYDFDRFRLYSHDRIQSVSDNAQASVQGAS